jgi:hypothetical protein
VIYTINVHGCDDTTSFEIELTDEEAAVAKRIADKCTETSTYGCMPTMTVDLKQEPK